MKLVRFLLSAGSLICLSHGFATLYEAEKDQPQQAAPTESAWKAAGAGKALTKSTAKSKAASKAPPKGAIGSISFPGMRSRFWVFGGDLKANGKRGPVWLELSSPIGSAGNTIIAGHRDTHFRVLRNLKVGDDILVEGPSGRYRYSIKAFKIVDRTERSVLEPSQTSVLTLVTCYPFNYIGAAPRRFIVIAQPHDREQMTAVNLTHNK